ncbi:hypothetical protein AB0I72_00645 [Nocardiopsis sp. NPDC049922]|uniref:hypothetical protein n=1 Tax=Nocardiopsis sp. NPDC049922 TaxID=3155157 RepID=UPI0033E96A66
MSQSTEDIRAFARAVRDAIDSCSRDQGVAHLLGVLDAFVEEDGVDVDVAVRMMQRITAQARPEAVAE